MSGCTCEIFIPIFLAFWNIFSDHRFIYSREPPKWTLEISTQKPFLQFTFWFNWSALLHVHRTGIEVLCCQWPPRGAQLYTTNMAWAVRSIARGLLRPLRAPSLPAFPTDILATLAPHGLSTQRGVWEATLSSRAPKRQYLNFKIIWDFIHILLYITNMKNSIKT
jgi:hypothetical protein